MISIYCIQDNEGLNYVGSTKRKDIRYRLWEHKSDKRKNHKSSYSKLLNLDKSTIKLLERCNEEERKEKEQFWIDKIDCVNNRNCIYDKKETDRLRELYIKTWGGNKRYENNLLRIDVNLFQ